MSEIKGAALIARLRYVRDRYGDEGHARVLASLAPQHREPLGRGRVEAE